MSWAPLVLTMLLAGSPPAGVAVADRAEAMDSTTRRGLAYGHLMRSLLSVRRGEFGSASHELEQALELDPDSPDLLLEAARLTEWTGRRSDAERLGRQALELDPDHREALRFVADLAARRALESKRADAKSRDEALRLYSRLAELDRDVDPDVLRMLTSLRIEAEDTEGAIDVARRLVEHRPGDPQAAHTLAQLLLSEGHQLQALTTLLRYSARHPFDEEMLGFTIQLTRNLEAWQLAAAELSPHAPFPAEITAFQRFHAEIQLQLGQAADAAAIIERALEENPDDPRLRRDLGLAYREMGRLADAADLFQGLVREAPDYPFLHELLGETRALRGESGPALAAFATALNGMGHAEQMSSHRDAVRQRMIGIQLDRGELSEAEQLIEDLELPTRPSALRLHAQVAIQAEDWNRGKQLTRELREAGEVGLAAFLDGRIAVGEGRWGRAKARFAEAVELLPASARHNVADVYRLADRPQDGKRLMDEWVSSRPEDPEARYLLGVYNYQIGRFDDAEPELREAFRLDPDHAAALNFLGYSLAERSQRLDEALGMVLRALEVEEWNGAYLDSLGWVYYQMGRFEQARVPLERAARELPNDPTVLEHLGDVYLSLGEPVQAVTTWRRALDAGTENVGGLNDKISSQDHATGQGTSAADGKRPPSPR